MIIMIIRNSSGGVKPPIRIFISVLSNLSYLFISSFVIVISMMREVMAVEKLFHF